MTRVHNNLRTKSKDIAANDGSLATVYLDVFCDGLYKDQPYYSTEIEVWNYGQLIGYMYPVSRGSDLRKIYREGLKLFHSTR